MVIGIAWCAVPRNDGPPVDEGHDVDAVDRIELRRAGRDGDGIFASGGFVGRDVDRGQDAARKGRLS
jgi:hypothetical protein